MFAVHAHRLEQPGLPGPHTWVLHRLREVTLERRPWLVGAPPVIGQQPSEQFTKSRIDEYFPIRQDVARWLSHVGDHLVGQILVVLSCWRDP